MCTRYIIESIVNLRVSIRRILLLICIAAIACAAISCTSVSIPVVPENTLASVGGRLARDISKELGTTLGATIRVNRFDAGRDDGSILGVAVASSVALHLRTRIPSANVYMVEGNAGNYKLAVLGIETNGLFTEIPAGAARYIVEGDIELYRYSLLVTASVYQRGSRKPVFTSTRQVYRSAAIDGLANTPFAPDGPAISKKSKSLTERPEVARGAAPERGDASERVDASEIMEIDTAQKERVELLSEARGDSAITPGENRTAGHTNDIENSEHLGTTEMETPGPSPNFALDREPEPNPPTPRRRIRLFQSEQSVEAIAGIAGELGDGIYAGWFAGSYLRRLNTEFPLSVGLWAGVGTEFGPFFLVGGAKVVLGDKAKGFALSLNPGYVPSFGIYFRNFIANVFVIPSGVGVVEFGYSFSL